VVEEFKSASEYNKHHDFNVSEDICLHELFIGVVEPPSLEFGNDHFSVKHESLHMSLMKMEVLIWVFVLNIYPFLSTPSKLTISLSPRSLALWSLRPMRILF